MLSRKESFYIWVVSGILFICTYLFKYTGYFNRLDNYFTSINDGTTYFLVSLISFSGHFLVTLIIISFLFYWIKRKKQDYSVSPWTLLLSFAFSMFLVLFLKPITGFLRPGTEYYEYSFLQALLYADYYAFPSGHTVRATVISFFIIDNYEGKSRYLLIIYPIAVGLSRVLLGVHYLSDIIGGWLIGIFSYSFISYSIPYWVKLVRYFQSTKKLSEVKEWK